ncbi:MAG TPA: MarC family protein [Steroidobacteraceae bacterium]|nr:MarC family protein [Steroidobacteraceae bacterium]
MPESILKFFVVFFVVVEPLSLVPAFAALTQHFTAPQRHQVAAKAVGISAFICVLFAIGGARLLEILGISLSAFRIGAGVLLFLIALDMVFARASPIRGTTAGEADEVKHRNDISVFPLAFPLMTGPGAMATIMLAFGESQISWVIFFGQMAAMLVVLSIAWLTMRLTGPMMRVMGVTGANVISRLFGVILAALAVQYIIDGIKGAMH